MPHLIYGQHVEYMFQTPTTRVWQKLHDEGKLNAAQDRFWNRKPPEELYDLHHDPDEVHNLVGTPAHQEVLIKLRQAQQNWARTTRDVGFLPEGERFSRGRGLSPYDFGHDDHKYPFDRVFAMAELASLLQPEALPALKAAFKDDDSAVRYWAALGILMRGREGYIAARSQLQAALRDRSAYVRIAAAEALGHYGDSEDGKHAAQVLIELSEWGKNDVFIAMAALNVLDALGDKVMPMADAIKALPARGSVPDARYAPYVPRLLQDLQAKLRRS
jgi:HEAT repeat protein